METCRHCKSRFNVYGDCSSKCELWFKDQLWLPRLRPTSPNPFLQVLMEIENKENILDDTSGGYGEGEL